MNVASLELCKELYELSGWQDTYWYHNTGNGFQRIKLVDLHQDDYPLYDLGYLLRKLPPFIKSKDRYYSLHLQYDNSQASWIVTYGGNGVQRQYGKLGRIPEDALCRLAIELFKQGLLSHDH